MRKDKMTAEEFFEKEEKREQRKKRIQMICIPLYYIIYIPLLVMCWENDNINFELLMFLTFLLAAPGIYYLLLFKPDLAFEIQYFFKFDIEDAKPSDWFYFSSKISAYISLIIGPVISVFMLVFVV